MITQPKGEIMTDNTKTELEKLIEAERAKAAAKIAKLKRDAEAEQRKVDAGVVALLKEQKPDLYDRLSGEVRAALATERSQRSAKAKRAAVTSSGQPVSEADDTSERREGVGQPWHG